MILDGLDYGVSGRTLEKGLARLRIWDLKDYCPARMRVDDRPYGGGPGMVMRPEPLRKAIRAARNSLPQGSAMIYLSPQGRRIDQDTVEAWSREPGLGFIAGRYEGVDERICERDIDEQWSLGDYILSGGELAIMVVIDAILRLLPGALGHEDSAKDESFAHGLLEYPHYTRPQEFDGQPVPDVLLNGNHAQIQHWRQQQAILRTCQRRPDLLCERHWWMQDLTCLDAWMYPR